MTLYEVNLEVDADAAESFAAWLGTHVEEMLALPGFTSAEWFERTDGPDDGRVRWTVLYRLEDAAAMERYFTEFAERMRGEGLARFDGRFAASRRVMRQRGAYRAA
jgi:quinol monooxygenase YgiN